MRTDATARNLHIPSPPWYSTLCLWQSYVHYAPFFKVIANAFFFVFCASFLGGLLYVYFICTQSTFHFHISIHKWSTCRCQSTDFPFRALMLSSKYLLVIRRLKDASISKENVEKYVMCVRCVGRRRSKPDRIEFCGWSWQKIHIYSSVVTYRTFPASVFYCT